MLVILHLLISFILVFPSNGKINSIDFKNTLIRNSTIFPMDIQWILQGYSTGFQGFFVEFLGLSDSINHFLPQAKLVQSSFKSFFNESIFLNNDLMINNELFPKEGSNIKNLISNDYNYKSYIDQNPPYFKFDMKSINLINNSICSSINFEFDTSYIDGNLPRSYVDSAKTPIDCCEVCVQNKLCLSWTYDSSIGCNLKGSMKLNVLSHSIGSSTSGKMISKSIDRTSILSARLSPPKALIYHGTTCIHQNQTTSPKNRDINTILIGRYMLERSHISKGMSLDEYAVTSCAGRVDEIWVPTEWHKDVFTHLFTQQGSTSSMPLITVIPEAVDTTLFIPNFQILEEESLMLTFNMDINVNQDTFLSSISHNSKENLIKQISKRKNLKECSQRNLTITCTNENNIFEFLSIFKWEYRKGWDILLDAYWKAFKPSDAVILRLRTYVPKIERGDRNITRVLETYALEKFGMKLHELATVTWEIGKISIQKAMYDDTDNNIDINNSNIRQTIKDTVINVSNIETSLTRSEIRDLLSSADAFVLPTRGEGWGLPIAEAMSMALPVIVTNHSGPTAYVNHNNAYLIPIHKELDDLSYAKPQVSELIKIFHQIIIDSTKEGQYLAQQKGLLARHTMKEISPDSIVSKIIARLRYHADIRGWVFP